MLPKSNRLPSPEIKRVFRIGKRISSGLLQIVFLPNQENVSRFAFIVSTRVDKRATRRNRIKRLMREAVRVHLATIGQGVDVVIEARSNKEEKIGTDLVELLRRASLL